MPAKIDGQIPQQNFELIRDQIASILALELSAQTVATNLKTWIERIIPFGLEELPAINIYYQSTPYDNHTPVSRRGINKYIIDIHVNAKHTDADEADKLAAINVQRFAGIVMYILSCGEWYDLGFGPGTIASRWVESCTIGRVEQKDALHTVVAQIAFNVLSTESVGDLTGLVLSVVSTQVKIDETEKGFLVELNTE
jgi:hypothetical protein